MIDAFYATFESELRGSRALIKARLRAYLPFLEALLKLDEDAVAIDLGCGRGEWLELLGEQGIRASGCDLDEGMLEACKAQGLKVQLADALLVLAALPNEACALVSGFHIAEHLPFADLQKLISEALRVLKPGGLLILETPNPENLSVGASSFYIDPTHERPLPPDLMTFLSRYSGYVRTKIVYLQEDPQILQRENLTVYDIVQGSSPDYALVAQKGGASEAQLSLFDAVFKQDFGVTLRTLSHHYQAQIDQQVLRVQALAAQTQAQVDALAAQTQVQMQAQHEQYIALLNSSSWRMTAPLRRAKTTYVEIRGDVKNYLCQSTISLSVWVLRKPLLKRCALLLLGCIPGLQHRLLRLVSSGAMGTRSLGDQPFCDPDLAISWDTLSPSAQELYRVLQSAFSAKKDRA